MDRFAHDLANKLSAIRMRAELALKALGTDEAKVRRHLEGIVEEAGEAAEAARARDRPADRPDVPPAGR